MKTLWYLGPNNTICADVFLDGRVAYRQSMVFPYGMGSPALFWLTVSAIAQRIKDGVAG